MLVPDNKKEVALTEKQETFLTALFGEAQGYSYSLEEGEDQSRG